MKLAIMQPYFFPYIGYFQLMAAVDEFVVYDNLKYTKKGWINRNRILMNGSDTLFSLPLKKDSDFLDICDRYLSESFEQQKLLNQFAGSYRRAPYFSQVFPLVESIVLHPAENLFSYLHHSLTTLRDVLAPECLIRVSSAIDIDHSLKSQDKVLALCQKLGAETYINPPGGVSLYSREAFATDGVQLKFLQPHAITYSQFDHRFVPWLSIIDVMMFNSGNEVRRLITQEYGLI
ncbi:WbqC family protein [Yokenella regensburgei]|uniref:WbqC family protein n=1 Tax=Yokenella regensburgei TaxID=158877 RepID=UPI003ED84F95